MDFKQFLEVSGLSYNTCEQYLNYWRKLPEVIDQNVIDRCILENLTAPFRSFLRLYIVGYLRRTDLLIPRLRGRKTRSLPKYLSKDEVEILARHAEEPDTQFIIEVALATGMRISEIVNLTATNLAQGRFIGKGNVESDLLLPIDLKDRLSMFAHGREHIFHINRKDAYHRIRYLGERFLNKKISPHWLRHTYAMVQRAEGKPIEVVRKLLRHKSISTTVIYFEVPEEELRVKWMTQPSKTIPETH